MTGWTAVFRDDDLEVTYPNIDNADLAAASDNKAGKVYYTRVLY